MSFHLKQKLNTADAQDDTSSSESDEDQSFDDWDDSLYSGVGSKPIKSLFDETELESVEQVLKHDKDKYGVDFDSVWMALKAKRVDKDGLGRVRLVNWIRKTKPTPEAVKLLAGTEDLFRSDEYLVPVIEDDVLLQYTPPTDSWSDDSESEDDSATLSGNSPEAQAQLKIKTLEKQLARVKKDFEEYREMVGEHLNKNLSLREVLEEEKVVGDSEKVARDDDTHYFESYGYNDIHATMLRDRIRTSSYAKFILTNPGVFRDKTVLDVGCGTGILSLFCAQAGARRIYAVDASPIASKAAEIVRLNGLDKVVKVVRGKVEDVQLPWDDTGLDQIKDGKETPRVDIIISEWMGYALLYESMLDSVLVARDRFLKPGGVMGPSECHMMFGLCDASELKKDRVDWWNDVYGFDLSPMASDVYTEAVIDVLGPNTMLSAPFNIKRLHLATLSLSTLQKFTSSFTLVSSVTRKRTVSAFVLYFDTFFTADGSEVPEGVEVEVARTEEEVVQEVWVLGGKGVQDQQQLKRRKSSTYSAKGETRKGEDGSGSTAVTLNAEPESEEKSRSKQKITSFSTGPQSIPTHWKQTVFLLREPFAVDEGSTVTGTFFCRKSEENSRELEVEIHYSIKYSKDADDAEDVVVQVFKVR